MTISVGVVGFGLSARVLHAPLIGSAGMRIVGVVTRQAAAVHAALPEARVLASLESLLDLRALDLVVVATPNDLHASQALCALRSGRHTLIDKPMAVSTLQADGLIEAAEKHRCKLAVFHNRRWDSDFLTIRRLLAEGSLGPLRSFEARWDRFRPQVPDRWRETAQAGGGVLFDLGSHLIDQVLCLFGMPDWLQADVYRQRAGAAVDDAFEIRMGKGELRISLGASSLAADHAQRYRMHGTAGSYCKSGMDVQETQLRAGMAPTDPAFGVEEQATRGVAVLGENGVQVKVPAERGNWLEFYRALRASIETGSELPVSAVEARQVLLVIEAARRSSVEGRRLALEPAGGEPV